MPPLLPLPSYPHPTGTTAEGNDLRSVAAAAAAAAAAATAPSELPSPSAVMVVRWFRGLATIDVIVVGLVAPSEQRASDAAAAPQGHHIIVDAIPRNMRLALSSSVGTVFNVKFTCSL